MTRFNTIDGLFRPNYHVYEPSIETKDSKTKDSYRDENITRVKFLKELLTNQTTHPEYREELVETPEEYDTTITINDDEKEDNEISITLKEIRESNPQHYATFRRELDKFIEQNPKYANIKESLDLLAALESGYEMGISNTQGSGALGWFQFLDSTRKSYNQQTRTQFAQDPQAQLLAAAKYYTHLQNNIRARGGDPKDFVTMYGAWWRPSSAYAYLKDPDYDYRTQYNESFSGIRKKAQDLLN